MEIGLYGKLPTHGDFLRRRAADAFVNRWDAWLQESIAASRRMLGERWLEVYLTSPVWRFACSAGVCGDVPVAGVLVPSVDRVGRYFPLTVVWRAPDELSPLAIATRCQPWFDAIEQTLIETLNRNDIEFEALDAELIASAELLADCCGPRRVTLDSADAASLTTETARAWRLPLGDSRDLDEIFEQLLHQRLRGSLAPLAMWWTEGSVLVEPSCLFTAGLPAADSFAAFLDGAWAESGWRALGGEVLAARAFTETLVESDVPIEQYRSASLSDAGRQRTSNQDAFLARDAVELWCVADGMGGHARGDLASRMICDALADLAPADTLPNMIDAVQARLDDVNRHLRAVNPGAVGSAQSGSTVVVMLTRRARCAVLWAGDSRAYRLRDGVLERLTTDHTWASEAPVAANDPGVVAESELAITRAVGGSDVLELDLHRDHVRKGDRYLLCSDGLTRELDDARIASLMGAAEPLACVHALMQAALDAGGRDNVTVVVIDAV